MANSAGERASARRAEAAFLEGTDTAQTWAALAGMKGEGRAQKKARMVAATCWAVEPSGICSNERGVRLALWCAPYKSGTYGTWDLVGMEAANKVWHWDGG
jgi:hypothetical protein